MPALGSQEQESTKRYEWQGQREELRETPPLRGFLGCPSGSPVLPAGVTSDTPRGASCPSSGTPRWAGCSGCLAFCWSSWHGLSPYPCLSVWYCGHFRIASIRRGVSFSATWRRPAEMRPPPRRCPAWSHPLCSQMSTYLGSGKLSSGSKSKCSMSGMRPGRFGSWHLGGEAFPDPWAGNQEEADVESASSSGCSFRRQAN